MEGPTSLDSIFKQKMFRIPDYQRGYAWQKEQYKDFWEDLVNLSDGRSHYTGVLTLKEVPAGEISQSEKEYWLVEDHSYKLYHIVDGQQRLTTFIIFLQSFVDFVKGLPENSRKGDDAIYITDTLTVADVQSDYLFKVKPTGDQFRTYKFGYTADNPSYDYLRYRVLNETGGGDVQETFYTLNLSNAKRYFTGQLSELYKQSHLKGLQDIYKRLTKRFLLNEYIIKDEFDVFVAFETMNNRGKKLSDLELLKNRLIYLTMLYDGKELDLAERKSLRDSVNDAWKEVYHQLGRNKARPLNDDDFLRAHWIMYFKYSRKTGKDYIRFLLGEQFPTKRVHKVVGRDVALEISEEQRSEADIDDSENENGDAVEETTTVLPASLKPTEIKHFVISLKGSAVHWFNSFYPYQAYNMSSEEMQWIDRLNRVGMGYFHPLVMAVLKKEPDEARRIDLFQHVERFIFIAFRMMATRSNYASSVFYNVVREVDRGETTVDDIKKMLEERLSLTFNADKTLRIDDFYNSLRRKFESDSHGGYYDWSSGLRYFLYEYELSLLSGAVQKKVDWDDLLKTPKDKISIEHIYPQTPTGEWDDAFAAIKSDHRPYYGATLGNLLLLSAAINSSLQNNSFTDKKKAKYSETGQKTRHGYVDGSHSEIEVSQQPTWGPDQIHDRGIRLLSFMEKRWDFKLRGADKEKLLFLGFDGN